MDKLMEEVGVVEEALPCSGPPLPPPSLPPSMMPPKDLPISSSPELLAEVLAPPSVLPGASQDPIYSPESPAEEDHELPSASARPEGPGPSSASSDIVGALHSTGWGAFNFTARPAGTYGGNYGAFEVQCPFHRKNDRTGCAKFIRIEGPNADDKQKAIHRAIWWCSQYDKFTLQREHMGFAALGDPPPLAELQPLMPLERPARRSIRTDIEIDIANAAAAEAECLQQNVSLDLFHKSKILPRWSLSIVSRCLQVVPRENTFP